MKLISAKFLILFSVFWVDFLFAEPMPWWEVSYNLDIKYPRMGDYKWEHNSEKIILKGEGENHRSFYKIDLALGDTVIYLDSSVFNYKGEDIPIVNWSFSEDGNWMLIQSKRHRFGDTLIKAPYILKLVDKSHRKVSKKNENLRNVKISPDSKWVSYIRDDNNLYVYNIDRKREKSLLEQDQKQF